MHIHLDNCRHNHYCDLYTKYTQPDMCTCADHSRTRTIDSVISALYGHTTRTVTRSRSVEQAEARDQLRALRLTPAALRAAVSHDSVLLAAGTWNDLNDFQLTSAAIDAFLVLSATRASTEAVDLILTHPATSTNALHTLLAAYLHADAHPTPPKGWALPHLTPPNPTPASWGRPTATMNVSEGVYRILAHRSAVPATIRMLTAAPGFADLAAATIHRDTFRRDALDSDRVTAVIDLIFADTQHQLLHGEDSVPYRQPIPIYAFIDLAETGLLTREQAFDLVRLINGYPHKCYLDDETETAHLLTLTHPDYANHLTGIGITRRDDALAALGLTVPDLITGDTIRMLITS